jgi:uncharacterized protein (DUF983 family)
MFVHDGFGGGHSLWMLFVAILVVVPFWRISQKAGYSGWLSLLVLVPLLNLGYLYFLAFAEWPAGRDGDQHSGDV